MNFGEYQAIVMRMVDEIERNEQYKRTRRWQNEGSLSGKGTVLDVSSMTVAKNASGSMFRITGLVRHGTIISVKGATEFRHGISEPKEVSYCFSVSGDGAIKYIGCPDESIDWIELRPILEAELREMYEREEKKTKEWLESPYGGGF